MKQRVLLLLVLLMSTSLSARTAREFTLQLSQEQWQEIGNPKHFKDDLIVLRTGEQLWGRLHEFPTLHYSFGAVDFRQDEVAGLSIENGARMQVVTRNGQNFIGHAPREPLLFDVRYTADNQAAPRKGGRGIHYVTEKIPVSSINFVLLKQRNGQRPRLINQRFHSVILSNGDRFPVIMATDAIHLSDGFRDFTLDPQEIVDIYYRGGVKGYTRGEALDVPLRFSFVKDKSLPVLLAKDNTPLRIAWSQIDRIYADHGKFIVTTPYFFSANKPDNMAYIPPGRFSMGRSEPLLKMIRQARTLAARGALAGAVIHKREAVARGLLPTRSAPSYVVEMPGFYIDRYEVTNAEYRRFVEATGHRAPRHWPGGEIPAGLEAHPVVNVSYSDAAAFAHWAGKRLPTEVEWERAAKGAAGTEYPYGKQFAPGLANVEGDRTSTVGSFAPVIQRYGAPVKGTAHKVYDMTGNVAEWTATPYQALPVAEEGALYQAHKLRPAASAAVRVVRGGSFKNSRHTATTHHRTAMHENDFNSRTGFRCARDG